MRKGPVEIETDPVPAPDALRQRLTYWRLAWKKRPRTKTLSLWKAIPSVAVAVVQFLLFRSNRPIKEMWIIILIIVAVYLLLSALAGLRNFVVISPVDLHREQAQAISKLTDENNDLRAALETPKVSAEEARNRKMVQESLASFRKEEKEVLQLVLDRGGYVNWNEIGKAGIARETVNSALHQAQAQGLMEYNEFQKLPFRTAILEALRYCLDQRDP
jgi:hypothetical protein